MMLTPIIKFLFGERDDLPSEPKPTPEPPNKNGRDESILGRQKTPYDPIIGSLKQALQQLLQESLPAHLQIAPDDALYLERIEITAIDDAPQRLLARFMTEFRSEPRKDFVQRELGKAVQRNLVLDRFTGVWEKASEETGGAPVGDAFEMIVSGAKLDNSVNPFEVKLIGSWNDKPVERPRSSASEKHKGMTLRLTLWDASSSNGRQLSLDTYPMQLCRKEGFGGDGQLMIDGKYVSSVHGILDSDGGVVTISDPRSRNGLWLNNTRIQPNEKLRLKVGDVIRFASAEDKEVDKYPRISVNELGTPHIFVSYPPLNNTSEEGGTPVVPNQASVTPLLPDEVAATPILPSTQLWAQLTVVDAAGSKQVDVTNLPYTIGRNHEQSYVVPDGNSGVSRKHLAITEINEQGACVVHPDGVKRYGTCLVGDEANLLPESFIWLYGQEILLAPNYPKAPPVKLTLRKVV